MELQIAYLYPQILNHYGDKGNILTLKRRLEARSIDVNIHEYAPGDVIDTENTDIIYLGGGTEKSQIISLKALENQKKSLKEYAENGGVMLAVCTGYEIIGDSFEADGRIHSGLGIVPNITRNGKDRLIGNIVIDCPLIGADIVGFENHIGRTKIVSCEPLGKVKCGYGNDSSKAHEGAIYKNVIGTYIHGPLLPKNPVLADYIISCALKKKYNTMEELSPIDDALENMANKYIRERFL